MKVLTHDHVKSQLEKMGYTLISTYYVDAHQKLAMRCDKCKEKRVATWNNLQKQPRCSTCRLKKLAGKTSNKIRKLEMREKLYNMSEVARILGVSPGDFNSAVRIKKCIPAPKRRLGNAIRRYYTEEDVREIERLVL